MDIDRNQNRSQGVVGEQFLLYYSWNFIWGGETWGCFGARIEMFEEWWGAFVGRVAEIKWKFITFNG